MNWPLFIVLAISCVLVVALVYAMEERSRDTDVMSAWQRQQLLKERHAKNPALRRR